MIGGNAGHSRIVPNVNLALGARLRGGRCGSPGPDAGVETTGKAVRYPDALVTHAKFQYEDRVILGVVMFLEVLNPTSGCVDRILKVGEYGAVGSIRGYAILESTSVGVTVMERTEPDEVWRTTVLTGDDAFRMPESVSGSPSPSSTKTLPSRRRTKPPPAECIWHHRFRCIEIDRGISCLLRRDQIKVTAACRTTRPSILVTAP